MTYKLALEELDELEKTGIKLGLKNIRCVLDSLGSPEKRYPSVHVAGTNGKGSVLSYIYYILKSSGYSKIGVYTSPHLNDVRERIRINEKKISRSDFSRISSLVKKKSCELCLDITYFEFITAVAFYYFKTKNIDIALIETGMGGRLDATNVLLDPVVSIVTNIGMDHREYLGRTLEEIALEKAGIFKKKGYVVSGVRQTELVSLLEKKAKAAQSRIYFLGRDFSIGRWYSGKSGQSFSFKGFEKKYKNLKIRMMGEHQIYNAAVALAAVEIMAYRGWKIKRGSVSDGLGKAFWPGRFEKMKHSGRTIILDGAHNKEAADALASTLKGLRNYYKKIILILGIMKDKDYRGMIRSLLPLADNVIITRPATERALNEGLLMSESRKMFPSKIYSVTDNTLKALKIALKSSRNRGDVICATGSLYTVGEIRGLLR